MLNVKQITEFDNAVADARNELFVQATGTVKRILFPFIGAESNEEHEMAEDFLSEAVMSLFQAIRGLETKKCNTIELRAKRQIGLWESYKKDAKSLNGYLHQAVINKCNTRCKRWSHDKLNKTQVIDEDDRSRENNKQSAVRARFSKPDYDSQTDEEWIVNKASGLQVEFQDNEANSAEKLHVLLRKKKISNEDYALMHKVLDGDQYKNLVPDFGPNPETVRKRYRDLLKKLGLKPSDFKAGIKI
jgi:hypothetical protein